MGLSAGIAGALTLALGLYLQLATGDETGLPVFVALLGGAALLFAVAALLFRFIREQPGATEGGGNALETAIESIALRCARTRCSDASCWCASRCSASRWRRPSTCCCCSGSGGDLSGLGLLIIASGLASSISAPIWGRLSDRSSRLVIALASAAAGLVGLLTWLLARTDADLLQAPFVFVALFLLLNSAHSGVRLGRKVYLVDMADSDTRAAMVAVSNTVIGAAMLTGGLIGIIADLYDAAAVILVLGIGSLGAAIYALSLTEVSEPA